MLPTLAEQRQVIAVEQQGHGHTADIDRPHLAILSMRDHLAPGMRPRWLLAMLVEFFAAPMPEAG